MCYTLGMDITDEMRRAVIDELQLKAEQIVDGSDVLVGAWLRAVKPGGADELVDFLTGIAFGDAR